MSGPGTDRPNNLPVDLTSFIGREREIAEVKRLLAGTRLLTVTGEGGCGKTRLARQVAADLLEEVAGGAWFVDLAVLSDPTLVPRTVAATLRVPELADRSPVELVADHLRPQPVLLVLDNCEHLLPACAHLTDALLRACPGLWVLATSREPLGVPGETIWRVPSLSLPGLSQFPRPDHLVQYEAVRLFVERAASVHPGFEITAGNALTVAQICHRLDGMPLAIELAAARAKALTVEQIAARLDDRFRLLTGRSPVVLPRHRTLRAAMDWSYDLLFENERIVLRRASVFAGGWTLEAAEGVCAGGQIDALEILDLLAQLVDKSLVVVDTSGGVARYRLLETVRQYGRDRLLESGEAEDVRRRHRDWYLRLAESAESELWGPVQKAWVARLEAEHDNLRAALEWSGGKEDGAEAQLRLAGTLLWFWFIHGDIREGRECLEQALTRGSGKPATARAKALCGAGILAWRLDEYDRASPLLQESLALFRELGDMRGIAFALHFTAHLAEARGNFTEAAAQFEESLAFYRQVNETWGIAKSLNCLGRATLRQGDHRRAEALLEEALPLLRKTQDMVHTASALTGLALIAEARGDQKRAAVLAEEGLSEARPMGHTSTLVAGTLLTVGQIALRSGDHARAVALLRESLGLAKRMGDREGIARCLVGLAGAAVQQQRLTRAARLFGAGEALREVIGNPLPPIDRPGYDAEVARLRGKMGAEVLAASWAAGRAMTLEDAIDLALKSEETEAPPGLKPAEPALAGRSLHPLTPREREVAALIAHGLTNREIAAGLVISERTAEGHVQSILNKLGFNARAQIAAWAVTHGLPAHAAGLVPG